ncbi:MAG TPA: hypothetical protein DDW73_23650 [Rhizobium sp.]|nr:hypothetical protein [Rhizobium sp.]
MASSLNLQDSRAAIESALAVCEARDALLLIADTSADEEKKAFWQDKSPHINYLVSEAPTAIDNIIFAVQSSQTPFIIPMADNDLLLIEKDVAPFDLADLPFDYIGVFPVAEIVLSRDEQGQLSTFSLEQDDATERMFAYLQLDLPDNVGSHAIFRREIWLSTLNVFDRSHPNKGAFADRAISIALFTSGKMACDQSLRYRYNFEQLATSELIAAHRQAMFTDAGLPEKTVRYEKLFQFLDVFVLVNRVGSPLAIDERQRLGRTAVQMIFGAFIASVANNPNDYEEGVAALAEMVLEEQDSFNQFQLGLLMAERVQPGLKDKYVTFIKAAISGL